jgi:hemerythrin-like domain-containing protein
MDHETLKIIRAEHAALRAVLRTIPLLLEPQRHTGGRPDFAMLRAMLFYVDEFAEQRHHRKESMLLFPKLRARTPRSRAQLDQLDGDHARGERRIRNLQHALLAFEMLGEPRRADFEQAAARYIEFYLAHMALEETEILPLAEKVLTEDDWDDLDRAFLGNRDALAGRTPEDGYRALFGRISEALPPTAGFPLVSGTAP